MNNAIKSFFGIKQDNKTAQKPANKPMYQAKQGEYNYNTDSTHDLKNAKTFSNTMTMATAGKAPTNVDFSAYNGFDSKVENPEFDMPTIDFYA